MPLFALQLHYATHPQDPHQWEDIQPVREYHVCREYLNGPLPGRSHKALAAHVNTSQWNLEASGEVRCRQLTFIVGP